ncbi:MAG: hypothetical protein AB8B99_04535 [Phormidesmis sp.]
MPFTQSNQKIDLAHAIAQLRSHKMQALFQTIGWQLSNRMAVTIQRQRCTPIANLQGVMAWQVILPSDTPLTPTLRRSLYTEIAEIAALGGRMNSQVSQFTDELQNERRLAMPLVIFIDAEKTRSLWCASAHDSVLYAVEQPTELWAFRLKRLSQYPQRWLSDVETPLPVADADYEIFKQLVVSLRDGITGISPRSDRDSYAMLTLQRLIFIQVMQAKGWLNQDRWYLQNLFGKATQTAKNSFFLSWLQPLYRSLALPKIERPLALIERIGKVPFLERVFDAHPLEETYDAISITDQPFENILGWLSEQLNSGTLNPFVSGRLGYWLWRYREEKSPDATQRQAHISVAMTEAWGKTLCAHSLETFLKNKILEESRFQIFYQQRLDLQQLETVTLNTLLFNANASVCRYLVQEVLPDLRILDPACGSGRLLAALNQRLIEIWAILTGYIEQSQDAQLKIWQSGIDSESATAKVDTTLIVESQPGLLLNLQKRVLKNNLYGIELMADAAETAQFQLLLATLAISTHPKALNPLPDLSFNVLTGNSLIGFIQVDEKHFEQVNQSGTDSVLQGNLLQPLAAESYQTILAEKNLALEHYKSRNQVLAAASNIPSYARASLLREEIAQLDANAQDKLNALLLNYMSQQLGIQYKAMQLADKPQRRLLTLEDIDVLCAFHWGYHFNHIIKCGGFNVIACDPPQGAFKPTTEDFLHRFQDLAVTQAIEADAFKTSKQALSKADPDIAQAWMFYRDFYAYTADYFYRSEQYAHQNPMSKGQSGGKGKSGGKVVRNQLMRERLFVERCFSLLAPKGLVAIALEHKLSADEKAQTLWQYLEGRADCLEQAICAENEIHPRCEQIILSCHKL